VPRNVQHLKPHSGRLNDVAFAEQSVGRRADNRQPERRAEVGLRVGQQVGLVDPDDQRGVGERRLQGRVPADVVRVAVRVQDRHDGQVLGGERFEDQVRFQPRVDHDDFAAVGQTDDVGVLGERLRHDGLNAQCHDTSLVQSRNYLPHGKSYKPPVSSRTGPSLQPRLLQAVGAVCRPPAGGGMRVALG
jgi:hypothetical protein